MMRGACVFAALAALGCAAESMATGDGDGDGDGDPGPALRITAPEQGELFVRDVIKDDWARVAPVSLAAESEDGVIVELYLDGEKVSDTGAADLELQRVGFYELEARAVSPSGETLASRLVNFAVDNPRFDDCSEWLDLYGIEFTRGPDRTGVGDPVTVVPPIGGIDYRYRPDATARADLSGDCELIVALAETVPILKAFDVVEIIDIGVYNYRCIGGGSPPDCPEGISQHAFAKAIDIAAYITADGETYTVNDDWVIDAGATCSATTENAKDQFLHEIICAQKAAGIWNIVLTPNFNAAHRDHFHVDLTPNGDYTRRADPREVDLGPDNH